MFKHRSLDTVNPICISDFDIETLNHFFHGLLYLHGPTLRILKEKNSRPDISILTAYEITPTTILKHVFHETIHEEVYIRIMILKVNA